MEQPQPQPIWKDGVGYGIGLRMDLYQRLGVQRGASEAEIKKAYRSLAKQLHPDRNKDNPNAAKRFGEVTAAYDLLSDKDKRAKFDRGEIDADGNPAMPFGGGFGGGGGGFDGFRRGSGAGSGGFSASDFEGLGAESDLSDLFEGLFGGRMGGGRAGAGDMGGGFGSRRRTPPPQRGANINYRLKVPFADAAALKPQRITLADGRTIDLKLPAGVEDGTQMRLKGKGQPGTGGHGDALVTVQIEPHAFFIRAGDDVRLELPVTLDEAVRGAKVKVPTVDGPVMLTVAPGSGSGKVLRLKGKGQAGPGGNGDALVTVHVEPHPFYTRQGDDVRLELPVTLDEAVRGAKVKVPTVDGPVMLTVAPGSGSGKVLRLKGKGFSRKGGGRGDQLVTLEIELPDSLDELAKRLEGWSDTTNPRNRLGV